MNRAARHVKSAVSIFSKDELPHGWELLPISEITERVSKVNPKDQPGATIKYIDISGIDNKSFKIAATKEYVWRDAPSRARQLVREGDTVFSTVRTYLKNLAIVPSELDGEIASTGFCVLRAIDDAYQRYLYYFVQFEPFLNELAKFQRGTSYPAVRNGDVLAQYIPIPPRDQVPQIIAEIEKQFSRLDQAVASLKRVKANLKRYKAAVLKAAVEGKLTEEWRKQNPDVEPASKLLERILAERRAKWEEAELAKMKARGKEPRNDNWKKRYKAPLGHVSSGLPKQPENWVWASVDQLAASSKGAITDGPFGSNLKTIHYTEEGPMVVRLQNIGYGEWFDEMAHISQERYESLKKHAVIGGDIIIAALGDPAPRACLVPENIGKAIVKADCIRFRCASDRLSANYLVNALTSWPAQKRTTSRLHGVGRPRLNLTEIKTISLPLPPLREQLRICEEVAARFSILENISFLIEQQLARSLMLNQAILTEAFSGDFFGPKQI